MINVKDNFIQSITVLVSGSVAAQAINVVTMLLMTRLFSSEDIGFYTYFITIVYLFLPVINGRYDLAIVAAKNDVYALIKLCIYISFILTILITALTGIYLFTNDEMDKYKNSLIVMPFLLLIAAFIAILDSYNNRERNFKLLSRVMINRAVTQFITVILFSLLSLGHLGLILSHCFSQIISLKKQSQSLFGKVFLVYCISYQDVFAAAKKYYKQPLYSMPAAFINSFSYSALNFFIVSLFGIIPLAYYSLSFRVLGMPLSLISQNVARVFFEEASREYHESGKFRESYLKTTKLLFMISVPMTIGVYLLAPLLCEIVFGGEWKIAGDYIQIMAVMFGIKFIASPLSIGLTIIQENQIELLLQCTFIISAAVAYLVTSYYQLNMEQFLILIANMYSFVYFTFWLYIYKASKGTHK